MDLEDKEMYGRQQDDDVILFDSIDEELPVSGNEDPLDSVKSVCLSCGCANGEHSPSCDEDFV